MNLRAHPNDSVMNSMTSTQCPPIPEALAILTLLTVPGAPTWDMRVSSSVRKAWKLVDYNVVAETGPSSRRKGSKRALISIAMDREIYHLGLCESIIRPIYLEQIRVTQQVQGGSRNYRYWFQRLSVLSFTVSMS